MAWLAATPTLRTPGQGWAGATEEGSCFTDSRGQGTGIGSLAKMEIQQGLPQDLGQPALPEAGQREAEVFLDKG